MNEDSKAEKEFKATWVEMMTMPTEEFMKLMNATRRDPQGNAIVQEKEVFDTVSMLRES